MPITIINIAYLLSGFYSLILILIGTPLNLLCYYIYTRLTPNRANATIIVFAHLALIELLIPFTWNINYVVRELIWKYQKNIVLRNLEGYSLFICKFISYAAYFSLQCAAWLKTLATFARCVSLYHQWSFRKYLTSPIIIQRVIWALILFIAFINLPIWFINGERVSYTNEFNQTKIKIRCYQSKFFQFWEIIHLLLYNFIPFTLMILCNLLIIRQVRQSRLRTQGSRMRTPSSINSSQMRRPKTSDGGRLTKTLILVTIFFIIFTSPAAIFYIFFGKTVKRYRDLITMSLINLATTSHVTSFIIYWLTSVDFRDAAISLLFCHPMSPRRLGTEERANDKPVPVPLLLSPTMQSYDQTEAQSTLVQLPTVVQ